MRLKSFALISCLSLFLTASLAVPNTYATSTKPVTDSTKPWTITFSNDVSNEAVNLDQITISSANKTLSLSVSANLNKVIVKSKKPYLFGERYTLTIPASFLANNGKELKKSVTQDFEITGQYIKTIQAILNPLLTNISITAPEAAYASYSINGGSTINMIRNLSSFSKGQIGLLKGDLLKVQVFDETKEILETHYYEVK